MLYSLTSDSIMTLMDVKLIYHGSKMNLTAILLACYETVP